jgi:hypothetical protein
MGRDRQETEEVGIIMKKLDKELYKPIQHKDFKEKSRSIASRQGSVCTEGKLPDWEREVLCPTRYKEKKRRK